MSSTAVGLSELLPVWIAEVFIEFDSPGARDYFRDRLGELPGSFCFIYFSIIFIEIFILFYCNIYANPLS